MFKIRFTFCFSFFLVSVFSWYRNLVLSVFDLQHILTRVFLRVVVVVSNLFAFATYPSLSLPVCRSLIKFSKWTFFWSRPEISSIIGFKRSSLFSYFLFTLLGKELSVLLVWTSDFPNQTSLDCVRFQLIGMHMIYHRLLSNQAFFMQILSQKVFIDTETYFSAHLAIGKCEDKLSYFHNTIESHIILKISHEEDIQSGVINVKPLEACHLWQ